jgi:ankyrin repeat protein
MPGIVRNTTTYMDALHQVYKTAPTDNQRSGNFHPIKSSWENIDLQTLPPNEITKMINNTMRSISNAFENYLGPDFTNHLSPDGPFGENMKSFVDQRLKLHSVMYQFVAYAELLSRLPLEMQKHYLTIFPPIKKGELHCLDGTSLRIDELLTGLQHAPEHAPLRDAHKSILYGLTANLVAHIPEEIEVHLPIYFEYALGLIPHAEAEKKDRFFLLPQLYLPPTAMVTILFRYPEMLKLYVDNAIDEQVLQGVTNILEIIKDYPNIGDIRDDKAIQKINDRLALENCNINDLLIVGGYNDDDDEIFVWKSPKEIGSTLYAKHPTVALLNKLPERYPAPDMMGEHITALIDPVTLFSEDASDHLIPLLMSWHIPTKMFAVNALWVMSEKFLRTRPGIFVPLLDNIIRNIHQSTHQNPESYLSNSLPEEQRFKLERILSARKSFDESPEISAYLKDPDPSLVSHIDYGASTQTIINRMRKYPTEITALRCEDADILSQHPNRAEILEEVHSQVVKNFAQLDADFIFRALQLAIEYNDSKIFHFLLDKLLTDENSTNILNAPIQESLLNLAVSLGRVKFINTLFKRGVDPNQITPNGSTALHIAAYYGQKNVIATLIQLGANPNHPDSMGHTPLHTAVMDGKLAAFQALLEGGANANIVNRGGCTPLHLAALKGQDNFIDALITSGVSPNQLMTPQRKTSIYLAAEKGHTATIRRLAELGADVNIANIGGYTPMHVAVYCNKSKSIETLCELGADINTVNRDHMTPINLAANQGNMELISILLDQGASLITAPFTEIMFFSDLNRTLTMMTTQEDRDQLKDSIVYLQRLTRLHQRCNRYFHNGDIAQILSIFREEDFPRTWSDTKGRTAAQRYLSKTSPEDFNEDDFNLLYQPEIILHQDYKRRNLLQTAFDNRHLTLARFLMDKLKEKNLFREHEYTYPPFFIVNQDRQTRWADTVKPSDLNTSFTR